jgi:hypothetical protein
MGRQHALSLVRTDDKTGGELWHCQACGHQMLLWWPPHFKRKVLVPGDESVGHVAGKGGIVVGSVEASSTPPELFH